MSKKKHATLELTHWDTIGSRFSRNRTGLACSQCIPKEVCVRHLYFYKYSPLFTCIITTVQAGVLQWRGGMLKKKKSNFNSFSNPFPITEMSMIAIYIDFASQTHLYKVFRWPISANERKLLNMKGSLVIENLSNFNISLICYNVMRNFYVMLVGKLHPSYKFHTSFVQLATERVSRRSFYLRMQLYYFSCVINHSE